jgi:hypothetical protein
MLDLRSTIICSRYASFPPYLTYPFLRKIPKPSPMDFHLINCFSISIFAGIVGGMLGGIYIPSLGTSGGFIGPGIALLTLLLTWHWRQILMQLRCSTTWRRDLNCRKEIIHSQWYGLQANPARSDYSQADRSYYPGNFGTEDLSRLGELPDNHNLQHYQHDVSSGWLNVLFSRWQIRFNDGQEGRRRGYGSGDSKGYREDGEEKQHLLDPLQCEDEDNITILFEEDLTYLSEIDSPKS